MQTLSQFQARFNDYAKNHPFSQSPRALYEPIDYILNIGGKRMRPVLTLMGHYLFEDNIDRALAAAYSVEIFHNFSLVHDDIMDEAPLRRGKATVHKKYDVNTGILSGDVMLIYAYQYLLQSPDDVDYKQLIDIFNQVAIEVCEGQQYDMNFEQQTNVSIPDYLKMIELKTAALVGGSLELGALIAGADKEARKHLKAFGRNVGIAFQLQDDILDTYGDPEKFGKKVGGDIVQNKKTFLVLKTLEKADPTTKDRLMQLMTTKTQDEPTKIKEVTALFDLCNIKAEAEAVKQTYQEKAFEHLQAISCSFSRKQPLINLANQLLIREI